MKELRELSLSEEDKEKLFNKKRAAAVEGNKKRKAKDDSDEDSCDECEEETAEKKKKMGRVLAKLVDACGADTQEYSEVNPEKMFDANV
jgi:hypothetical protein